MKILIFTDPHRGFNEKTHLIQDKVFSSIDPNSFDLIIVSGDWGTTSLDHVRGSFKAFRKAFPNKKILGVLGNHDLWDQKLKSLELKFERINHYAKESDIHLLENNPYEENGVLFLGFNGWYHYSHPDTRDSDYMAPYVGSGAPVDIYLKNLADKAIYFMMDYPKENKKIVSVTHFPCIDVSMDNPTWNGNPKHGEILKEFSDLIIFGHTHKALDMIIGKSQVINVGSDYNKLAYKIIEIKK